MIGWRVLGVLTVLAAIFAAGMKVGSDHVQSKWDEDVAEKTALHLARVLGDSSKLHDLEEAKNENMAEIDRLRANNHALWLRIPRTPCAGASSPGTGDVTGGGQLPEGAPDRTEEAVNEFDKRWAEEAYRADAIVEACRVLNDFLP